MKVLCPQCDRLSELEQYRFDNGMLVVTCMKCGAATRSEVAPTTISTIVEPYLASMTPAPVSQRLLSSPEASNVVVLKTPASEAVEQAAVAAKGSPFEVPAGSCPKCFTKKADGSANCNQCGLVFENFDPEAFEAPPWLAEEWLALLRKWGDETKHDLVRKKAVQSDALAIVGRLYRLRLAAMPDDPFALNGRDEVVRMASVPVSSRSSVVMMRPEKNRLKMVATVGLLMISLFAAVVMFRLFLGGRGEP